MKKIFILLMILSILRLNFLIATDYATQGEDVYVNIIDETTITVGPLDTQYSYIGAVFRANDTIGWDSTSTGSYGNGIVWCPNGVIAYDGDTGAIDFASPLAVQRSLCLSMTNTLRLRSDLILQGRIDILHSGRIDGTVNHIILNGPMYLDSNYIEGHGSLLSFIGNGNTIFFNKGGYISQSTINSGLEFRNIVLDGLDIVNTAGDSNLILDDTVIKLNSDFCFNGAGKLGIYNDVLITGTHTFCLDGTCQIYDNARLMFDVGTTFSMGLHSNITMMDNHMGSIYFNGSYITVADANFSVDYGRIIFENEVTINDESNYRDFVMGANTGIDVLGNARIVLENTTTFSIL